MCSSTCVRVEAARQARLTAPGCATLCSAVETDVAANPAGWDRNSGGPGSGHDPRGPHPVGLVPEPSLGYCTLAGAAHQASSSDLGGATGTGPWTDTNRNLALDHLAELNLFHCKFRSQGCSASLAIAAKQKHEMSCEHGPCSCVLGSESCSWRGRPEKLVDHVLRKHDFIPRLQGENVVLTATSFDSVQDYTWYALQTCHGHDFLVMMKKSTNSSFKHFFGVVVLVGSSDDERRFQYRLQLSGSDRPAHLRGQDARHPLPGRVCREWRRPDFQYQHSRVPLQWC
ncbi:hypothetical protein MTO96_017119 [Rhipicephalus appendiculatus]